MKNLFLCLLIVSLYSCAPVLNLESGRTNGDQVQGFQANISGFYVDDSELSGVLPSAEVRYNYGITSKLDIGVSATSGGNGQFFTKYQFLGNQESKLAMSIGLKIGKQLSINGQTSPTRFYVPLYFSIHPNEKIAFFINPMYMKQKVKLDHDSDLFGLSAGTIFYINENELSLGANYNTIKTNTENDKLITFGAGYKFKF